MVELLEPRKAAPRPPSPDYVTNFRQMQKLYMDYPRMVHIETMGLCNARCTFCPNSVSPRRHAKMSDALFDKILGDLKQIPVQIPLAVLPFKLNEPLLDAQLPQRMKTIARELPGAELWLTSNFNVASQDLMRRLSEVPRFAFLWISLNSLREDEYRQWMGLELRRTVENVVRLLALNRHRPFLRTIVLGRVGDGSPGDTQFVADAREVFAGFEWGREFEVRLLRRGQWMGHCTVDSPQIPELPCLRWFELSITCTGEVAFCCMDGLCKYPLGDVNRNTVLEIYNLPAYRELRQQCPPRRIVEPCIGCSFL